MFLQIDSGRLTYNEDKPPGLRGIEGSEKKRGKRGKEGVEKREKDSNELVRAGKERRMEEGLGRKF